MNNGASAINKGKGLWKTTCAIDASAEERLKYLIRQILYYLFLVASFWGNCSAYLSTAAHCWRCKWMFGFTITFEDRKYKLNLALVHLKMSSMPL